MRRGLYMFVVASLASYPLFCVWQNRPITSNAPIIELPSQSHDFGISLPASLREFTFSTENTLAATLYIDRIVASCGCTNAQIDHDMVSPGQAFAIRATLATLDHPDSMSSQIEVFGHASHQRIGIRYSLASRIEGILEFPDDSGSINLGSWTGDELPQCVALDVKKGKYPLRFDEIRVDCDSAALSASALRTAEGVWTVKFLVHPTEVLGTNGYRVVFRCIAQGIMLDQTIEKQAYFDIQGSVVATPTSLLLTVSRGEHLQKTIELSRRAPASRTGGLQITDSMVTSINASTVCHNDPEHTWITFDYTAPTRPGYDRGEIVASVLTGGVRYKLRIGYLAIVSD